LEDVLVQKFKDVYESIESINKLKLKDVKVVEQSESVKKSEEKNEEKEKDEKNNYEKLKNQIKHSNGAISQLNSKVDDLFR